MNGLPCLECVAVISRLGYGAQDMFAAEAAAHGITVNEARRRFLATYHERHREDT